MRAAWAMALALAACRSQEPRGQGEPVPAPISLRCERLLPEEVREPLLSGFTLHSQEWPCPSCGPLCSFRSAQEPNTRVSVAIDCRARYAREDVGALLAPTLAAGGEEVPALGRAAARFSPTPGLLQVLAWDDNTPCLVIVTWLGPHSERATALAERVLRSTTPERLRPPPLEAPPPPPPLPLSPEPPGSPLLRPSEPLLRPPQPPSPPADAGA